MATIGCSNLGQSHIGALKGHRNAYLDADISTPACHLDRRGSVLFYRRFWNRKAWLREVLRAGGSARNHPGVCTQREERA